VNFAARAAPPNLNFHMAVRCGLAGKEFCGRVRFIGGSVAEYRIYIIAPSGQFLRALELLCSDDESAKEYAKQLVDGVDVELWEGDRRVERFQHTHE
jgi:hypothetical protein